MDYRTYRHDKTGEQIMTDPRHSEGKRVEGDAGWQEEQDAAAAGGDSRIVETSDPEKASRIGYRSDAGNTAQTPAEAAHAAQPTTDKDKDKDDEDDDFRETERV